MFRNVFTQLLINALVNGSPKYGKPTGFISGPNALPHSAQSSSPNPLSQKKLRQRAKWPNNKVAAKRAK